MNVLVIGFGNMGCRHAQSLLNRKKEDNIYVLEPNKEIIEINKSKIGDKENRIVFIDRIDDLPFQIDFAIVATSAYPRFEIVKRLLDIGIKKFLLEKVVFQSENQFDIVIKMLNDFDAVAYCNFVNRYFPNYQTIKKEMLKSMPFKMIVSGADFGLGCNALHYVDLFEFLSNEFSYVKSSNLFLLNSKNRRGDMYKEVSGQLSWGTLNGNNLLINADVKKTGGVEIIITQGDSIHILNEESLKHIMCSSVISLKSNDFIIKYTSELTNVIVNDVLEGNIILPTVQETKNCHTEYFTILNKVFGLSNNDLCPIT
nr:Gfo/Idh/MocA family oxidoreductase [uncultured Flavobacterium sp.]